MSRWFGTGQPGTSTEAQIDLRVGGRFRIVNHLPGGDSNDVSGEYLEVAVHSRLVFTWAWRSTPDRVSRVSIDFLPSKGGTALRFVHDRFFDEQARRNHEGGWQTLFDRFDAALQGDAQEAGA